MREFNGERERRYGRGWEGNRGRHDEEEEGWQAVRSRRNRMFVGGDGRRRTEVAALNNRFKGGNVSSFFFTYFSDTLRARDMYDVFSKHGRIHEVVIPDRRNASGKRFGFVRFFDVAEPERLAIYLDNIFVEGEKIHVNLPRFQRETNANQHVTLEQRPKNVKQVWKPKLPQSLSRAGQSFKDVVLGRNKGRGDSKDGDRWSFDTTIESTLSKAMVREVVTPGNSYYIQDELVR